MVGSSPKYLALYENNRGNLRDVPPPTLAGVLRANELFAVVYDAHMRGHHTHAIDMIGGAFDKGHVGRRIVAPGDGTGILTSSLALKAIARMDREGGDRPYEIVCSDISQVMLKIARRNAREKIQRANNIRAMSRGRLTICETDAGLDVLNGTRKILEVRFVIAGVHELDRLAGDDGVDTFLTAYIQHWITSLEPGVCALEAKIAMNRKIYELLKPGGTEISVEEYPLIVRTDRLDEGMEELPELIQANTSIISIDTLRRIWADIGFTGVCTQQRQIDDLVEHIERCDVQKKAA